MNSPANYDLINALWKEVKDAKDVESIQRRFIYHTKYTLSTSKDQLTHKTAYKALAHCMRETLVDRLRETLHHFEQQDVKQVAYMSMEYLLGRSLQNAIYNLGLEDEYSLAVKEFGYKLEELCDQEVDPGLGNGGLGRLAACFMDSLATLDLPGWGYGLRYTYGIFAQKFVDGRQVERPDTWLAEGNPWEIERPNITYPVRFYGDVTEVNEDGRTTYVWSGGEIVTAAAYDTPIPGFSTYNTLAIRLWSARAEKDFDLSRFNEGEFSAAYKKRQRAITITSVLYPNDKTEMGRELRLKQQYFFVSATLQDLMRRFKKRNPVGQDVDDYWRLFPKKFALQLNDTHPTLAIPELMRLLVDEEGVSWEVAWEIAQQSVAYTNHTVLPEALEKWPVGLVARLLPRHMKIIYDINHFFLEKVVERYGGDFGRMAALSVIKEEHEQKVRMANLAIVGSFAVNGVAAIHSNILKTHVFPEFYDMWPHKFQNKTNGVTPRRWVHQANPRLASLLTATFGSDGWLLDLNQLENLRDYAENEEFQNKWLAIRRENKLRLIHYVKKARPDIKFEINPDAMFDVHIKRIHEYKRQFLNILSVMHRYREIKKMSAEERRKQCRRVIFFAGKAAPGYFIAKLLIKLINNTSEVINNDAEVGDLLKVIYMPNYSVSQAEILIPAADISQQVSTAGTEASGTGNMKFAMNGALIVGTMDGANIEISEQIGEENMFIFGATADEVDELREQQRQDKLQIDQRFTDVLNMIKNGVFGDAGTFQPLLSCLEDGRDYYLLGYDFPAYLEVQQRADETFLDKRRYATMSIMSSAGSGVFSSDRTIKQYAADIWHIQPCRYKL